MEMTLSDVVYFLLHANPGSCRRFVCPGMEGYLYESRGKIYRHVGEGSAFSFKEHELPVSGYREVLIAQS